MLSRVAANIYWLARYVERAENTARIINVNTHLMLDLPSHVRPGWQPIINILGGSDDFLARGVDSDERAVLRYLISDMKHASSITSSLAMARENGRTIRDIIPREGWEVVNDLFLHASENAVKGISRKGRYDYLQHVITGSQTLSGLLEGTMLHDEGIHFLRMGRHLERADMTTRIIDVRTSSLLGEVGGNLTPFENIQWMSILKSLTAYQMYRRAVQSRVRRSEVLQFLLLDTRFPRSFLHALGEVEASLKPLPHHKEALAELASLKQQVGKAVDEDFDAARLHAFLDELQIGLGRVHAAIDHIYFLH